MSYCRWSSDNWMCDVYVYEAAAGGFTTHVATRRLSIPPIPEVPWTWIGAVHRWAGATFDDYMGEYRYASKGKKWVCRLVVALAIGWRECVHVTSLKVTPLRKIGLEHDGEMFSDRTAGECAERLEYLRGIGYKVPQYAIDNLRSEEEET